MESQLSPKSQFQKATAHYYGVLKQSYQEHIDKAIDKAYAARHYQRILFTESVLMPVHSVFYNELIAAYSHFYKLGYPDALEQTLEYVPQIRQLTTDTIEQSTHVRESLNELYDELHPVYTNAVEQGRSLLELLHLEQELLQISDERIIHLIAHKHVTDQLLAEVNEEATEEADQPQGTIDFATGESTVGQPKLTRSQQVLITYYLLQLLGVKHKKNVSKCVDALHTFLGIPYGHIGDSELYKKMLKPLAKPQSALMNLQVIRPFFEKLQVVRALELIDTDIEKMKTQVEESKGDSEVERF